ncbi:MAG: A/G-specific adenine glycosylase [Planctomycetia bacterium]|nr:A/G-specific adenine glycosylase [Planctomycetia bacterium]
MIFSWTQQTFVRDLFDWFEIYGREHLPWRVDRAPYNVWVSEIMLQQTQVAKVLDYYSRFLEKFPNVSTLAEADEEEVLRLWEGLGYYRRARQLHAAARQIVERFGGVFPSRYEDVLSLPGVGRYTAGAIMSFAYDKHYPILEANTQRLFSRLIALRTPTAASESQKRLWEIAGSFVSRETCDSPRIINTALMDLGSLICTPNAPQCEKCPLQNACEAFKKDLTKQIPVAKKKVFYENRHEIALVIWENAQKKRVCLVRCKDSGRWGGLWDFPRAVVLGDEVDFDFAQNFTKNLVGLALKKVALLQTFRHGVTKYRIFLECFEAFCEDAGDIFEKTPEGECVQWVEVQKLRQFPLSSTGRQIAQILESGLDETSKIC